MTENEIQEPDFDSLGGLIAYYYRIIAIQQTNFKYWESIGRPPDWGDADTEVLNHGFFREKTPALIEEWKSKIAELRKQRQNLPVFDGQVSFTDLQMRRGQVESWQKAVREQEGLIAQQDRAGKLPDNYLLSLYQAELADEEDLLYLLEKTPEVKPRQRRGWWIFRW